MAQTWEELVRICKSVRRTAELTSSDLEPIFKKIGIFSRAQKIIELARTVSRFYRGTVPRYSDELASLPGIGQYIASAVRVIAFGEQDFPVDSNAFRFVERYLGIPLHGRKTEARDIRDAMKRYVPEGKSREFLFGFLDFMAEICSYSKPECDSCLLRDSCKRMRASSGVEVERLK